MANTIVYKRIIHNAAGCCWCVEGAYTPNMMVTTDGVLLTLLSAQPDDL